MDIKNDPLYKEAAAWKEKNKNLHDHIMGLFERITALMEKRRRAENSKEVREIDSQIVSLRKEIEQSISTMEYGIPMTEVTNNG